MTYIEITRRWAIKRNDKQAQRTANVQYRSYKQKDYQL